MKTGSAGILAGSNRLETAASASCQPGLHSPGPHHFALPDYSVPTTPDCWTNQTSKGAISANKGNSRKHDAHRRTAAKKETAIKGQLPLLLRLSWHKHAFPTFEAACMAVSVWACSRMPRVSRFACGPEREVIKRMPQQRSKSLSILLNLWRFTNILMHFIPLPPIPAVYPRTVRLASCRFCP